MTKLIIVIGHFKENLDWVNNLKYPYIVYNKNPDQYNIFEHNMPNEGFDSAVYLKFIIDNYDSLPEFICFSQDNPFPHCNNFVEIINNFNFDCDFTPLGTTFIRDVEDILDRTINYAKKYNIKYNLPIKFTSGNQYIISKKLILKNSINFYKTIFSTIVPGPIISETNYILEYLFPTIFHFNENLKTTY